MPTVTEEPRRPHMVADLVSDEERPADPRGDDRSNTSTDDLRRRVGLVGGSNQKQSRQRDFGTKKKKTAPST